MKELRKYVEPFVSVLPFVMLGITLATAIASSMDFYTKVFKYLPDSIGYSIATNIVFLYHYSFNKYCNPTRVAVIGLLLMNVVSLATKGTEYYNTLHDIYIGGAVMLVLIVLYVKRW